MVAVVSGNSLGLFNSSLALIGPGGAIGTAPEGRGNERLYINSATGNLTVQSRDEVLTNVGTDLAVVRTYNSQGLLNDDNADNWRIGVYQSVVLSGTVNTAGSTVTKTFSDGAAIVYAWNTSLSKYLSTAGDGAHDTLSWNSGTSQWTWTDGSSRATETFNSSGKITASKDVDGNTVTYVYTGNLITSVTDSSGQTTFLDYTGNNLTAVRVVSNSVTQTITRYTYDASNRLSTVKVDMSPGDNVVTDNNVFLTTYTYDGTSTRVASISQGHNSTTGETVSFTYQLIGSTYWLKTYTDGEGKVTTMTYSGIASGIAATVDIQTSLGLVTTVTNDTSGRLTKVQAPTVGGVRLETRYAYDSEGNISTLTEDPAGLNRITTFTYYANTGLLDTTKDQLGNTTKRTYSATNQLLTDTRYTVPDTGSGASGPMTTRYAYDSEEHLRFIISPEGRVTEYRYNANGTRSATIVYTAGHYDVSALGATAPLTEAQLTTWIGTQNLTLIQRTDYAYDFRGNVSSATAFQSTDSSGNGVATGASITRYVYDQRGLLLSIVDPRGEATSGDPNDYVTSFTYDGLGRQQTKTEWLGASSSRTTTTTYDDDLNRTVVTYANGLVTTSQFDKRGLLVSFANSNLSATPLGTTTYIYDADRRLRGVTDPVGAKQYFLYDEAGRQIGKIDGDGTLTETVYDRLRQPVKQVVYADRVPLATRNSLIVAGVPQAVTLATVKAAVPTTVGRAFDQITRTVYDASGRVVYTIDANRYVTQTFYDGAGQVTNIVMYSNAAGTIASTVDELRPVAAELVAGNAVTTRTFNNTSGTLVASLTLDAANDRRQRNFYSSDGFLLGTLDPAGYLVEYKYDDGGRLVQKVAYANLTDSAQWNAGTLTQLRPALDNEVATDPEQDANTYLYYDRQGRRIGELDAEGYLTETTYDVANRPATVVRYDRQLTYNSDFTTLKSPIVAGDKRWTTFYSYDGAGRAIQQVERQGTSSAFVEVTTTYTYDGADNLTSSTAAAATADARTTQTKYDELGRVLQQLTAEGSAAIATGTPVATAWAQYAVTHTYDLAGHRKDTTDQNGNKTRYFYDADDRLIYTVNALGEVTETRYNALDQVTDVIQYATRITSTALAGLVGGTDLTALQTALVTTGPNAVTSYTYKLNGQVASQSTVGGALTNYTRNAFGEATQQDVKLNSTEWETHTYQYNKQGLATVTHWDPSGIDRTETDVYDAFGRLKSATDQYSAQKRYEYDRLGRVITTYDALNHRHRSTYDAFDRVYDTYDAYDNKTTYRYDDDLRRLTVTTPEGVSVVTIQNAHGDVVSVTSNGNTTTYTYDPNGQLKTVSDGLGSLESRLYDKAGRETDRTNAVGSVTHFAYDAVNRLWTRTEDYGDSSHLNLVTTFAYDPIGRTMDVTDPNGRVTHTDYDVDGHITQVAVDPSGLNLRTVYTYDNAGRTITVVEGSGSTNPRRTKYVYDKLGQRTHEYVDSTDIGGTLNLHTEYRYDRAGNLYRKIDPSGFSTWFLYDAAGRVTYTLTTFDAAKTKVSVMYLDYDNENRIIATRRYVDTIAIPSTDQVTTVNMGTMAYSLEQTVYDRDGRAAYSIGANYSLTERTFDAAGNVVREHVYANPLTAGTYATVQSVVTALGASNGVIATGDRVRRSVYDLRNRVEISVDGAGAVTRYKYDADGNVTEKTEYAATVPMDGAMRVWFVPSTNSSASRYVGNFSAGDVVTATVRFKSASDTSGAVFLGDAGGPNPYDNAVYSGVIYGNDGWKTISVSVTLSHADDVWVYVYGDRDGAYANSSHNVVYDNVTVSSTQRGRMLEDTFEGGVGAWSISGNAQAVTVSMADTGNDASIRAFVDSLANASKDQTTRYWYDKADRVRFGQDAEGYLKETRYIDASRQQVEVVYGAKATIAAGASLATVVSTAAALPTAQNQTTTNQYDYAGRLTTVTASGADIANRVESYTYDAVGNRKTYVNANGKQWDYQYDANHRLIWEDAPLVDVTTLTGTDGALATPGAPANIRVRTSYEYDARGNLTARVEASNTAQNRRTEYLYDAQGRQLTTTLPSVGVYNPGADSITASGTGVIRRETPTVLTTTTDYDALGNAWRYKDTAGNYSYKLYDSAGRLTTEIDAKGYVTEHAYDTFGNETRLTRYANAYTGTLPTSGSSTITYPTSADDRAILTTYNRLNRAIKVEQPQVYVWDPTPLANAYGGTGYSWKPTIEYQYDAFGNVILERRLTAANPSLVYADTYHYYDRRNMLVADVDPLGFLTTYQYDETGDLTRKVEFASAIPWWNTSGYASPEQVSANITENLSDTVANGVTVTGSSAAKTTGTDAWDTGFRSRVGYTGGATVTFTVPQNNKYLMVGLNTDPTTDNSYVSIDWALYAAADGNLYVYENGSGVGPLVAYSAGDVLSVSYDGTKVRYFKNGVAIREVAATITQPLYCDSSFYTVGGRIDNLDFQGRWVAKEGVAVQNGSAKKLSGGDGWTGGFTSNAGYTNGASVSWTASQTNAYLMVGLNTDPLYDTSFTSIDYAMYLRADQSLAVYESGNYITELGTYTAGDTFRVVYDGTKVRYLRNGVALREVTVSIPGPLYADSSFYTVGGEVSNLQFGRGGDDREATYTYDSLNRVTSETLLVNSNGGLVRDRATTSYGYDAVGNRVSVSVGGATTYTYYDELGRVRAIAEPTRDVDGSGATVNLTPLTVIRRDARGNAVEQIQYANGTASAAATSYTAPVLGNSLNPDRDTLFQFDALDRVVQTRDGVNAYRLTSYNARGDVVKEWQPTTNNSGTAETIVTRYTYDQIGRQTRIEEPQTLNGTPVVIDRSITYNAFGEITGKTIVGGAASDAEVNKYDQAGRLWFSNSGDGVDKIYLYNLAGQATAVIRSKTNDLAAVTLVQVTTGLAGITQMRTETVYDAVGNVVEQRDASFTSAPLVDAMASSFAIGKPIDSRVFVYWSAPPPGIVQTFIFRTYPSGSWSGAQTVVNLGNGYYGVDVTGLNNTYEFRVTLTRPGDSQPYAIHAGTFVASTTTNVSLTVTGGTAVGTIGAISTTVSGTSVTFMWSPGPVGTATLEVKPTSGSTWQSVSAQLYTDGYTTSFMYGTVTGIGAGTYDYRITYVNSGLTTAIGTGTLTVTAQTSSTTGSASPSTNWGNAVGPLSASASGGGATSVGFSWASPGGTQTFAYKLQGTSTWTSINVTGGSSVNLGVLASGTYDWSYSYVTYDPIYGQPNGGGSAAGYFVVNGASSYSVQQSGAPAFTFTPSTPPITTTLSWPIDSSIIGTPSFSYRPVGGSWTALGVTSSGGQYQVSANNLSGNYEWQVTYQYTDGYYSYTTATASGTFSVSGLSASVTSQTGTPSYLAGVTASGNRIYWSRALQSGDTLTVTLNGSTSLSPQTSDGTNYSASFDGLATGSYNYEIAYTKNGQKYVSGTGVLSITTNVTPPAGSATTPVGPGTITGFQEVAANSGLLGWTTAATAGDTIVFRYRQTGATTWAGTLTAVAWGSGYYVDWGPSLSGSFQYEVMYTHSGQTTPYRVANGTTVITRTVNSTGSNLTDTTSATAERTPQSLIMRLRQVLDRWGNVLSFTDATLQTTDYLYNERNQVAQVKAPTVLVVSTLNNTIASGINARPTSRNFYDAFGRLLATVDANGNRNKLTLNAAGQVVGETLADATSFANTVSGTRTYYYNAFGDRVQVTDELGYRTRNTYDAVGQLTATTQELIQSGFSSASNPYDTSGLTQNLISRLYTYDQAGRRKTETSGALMNTGGTPETTQYWYDLLGNVIKRRSPRSFDTLYEYDQFGNGKQTKQTDAIQGVLAWTYDAWGRLKTHTDIVGDLAGDGDSVTTTYNYNEAGLLSSTTDTRSHSVTYAFDESGRVISITEAGAASGILTAINRVTTFTYDVAGRVTREKIVVDNLVHQDTTTTYDALGRISHISDPRYTLTYQYDAAGNRTHISARYFDQTGTSQPSELWYSYDGANRVKISQGANSSGTIAINTAQGIELTYNARGERATANQYGTVLTHSTGYVFVYPDFVNPVSLNYWQESGGYDQQAYSYDGAGRLTSIQRYYSEYFIDPNLGGTYTGSAWMTTDTRTYDGASRQISQTRIVADTSATGPYNIPYITRVNASTYDDDGRLWTQTTSRNGVAESSVLYGDAVYSAGGTSGYYDIDPWGNPIWYEYTVPATWSRGWDPAGNLRGYTVTVYNTNTPSPTDVAYTQNFSMTYRSGDTYQETSEWVSNVNGTTTAPLSGYTSRTYNVNNELVQYTDSQDQNKNRYFANNAMGQALNVITGNYGTAPASAFSGALNAIGTTNPYKLQSMLVANGQQVGSLQSGGTGGLFKASFDVNYTPVSDDFPSDVPSEVVAQEGDTLRIVAARVFGDASLWYLIAQENGLSDPNAVIQTGRVLRIPNDVVSVSNTSSTFKPYNVKAAIGDTTPTQPLPPPPKASSSKKGCGVLGMILVIIVVIVVSVVSYGGGSGWAAAWGSSIAGTGTGGAIVGGAIAGAAGSIAGQVVGLATGVQDKFDWKGVALGAIGGGVSAGIGFAASQAASGAQGATALGRGLDAIGAAGRAAVGSILTQGIAVATGLQESFNWREVAISAAAGYASDKVSHAVLNRGGSQFTADFASAAAGSLVRATLGGKVDAVSIVADAFGQALANNISTQLAGAPKPLRSAEDRQVDNFLQSYNERHPGTAVELFPDVELADVSVPLVANPSLPVYVPTQDELRSAQFRTSLESVQRHEQQRVEPEQAIEEIVVTGRRMSAAEIERYDAREGLRALLDNALEEHKREESYKEQALEGTSMLERGVISLGGIMYNAWQSAKAGVVGIFHAGKSLYEFQQRVLGDMLHGDLSAATTEFTDALGLGVEKTKALVEGARKLGVVLGDEESRKMLVDFAHDYYGSSSQITQSELLGALPMELLIAAGTAGAGTVVKASGMAERIGVALGRLAEALRAIEVRTPFMPELGEVNSIGRLPKMRSPLARLGTLERGDINKNVVGGVPDGYAGHHLITIEDANEFSVMRRAAALGYDINRGSNGIALPRKVAESLETGLPLHTGRHLMEYGDLVRSELTSLQSRYRLGRIPDSSLLREVGKVENRIRAALINNEVRLQSTDLRPRP